MKTKILTTVPMAILATIFFTAITVAQQLYELTPGTKGNQIVLQLSNISQTQSAENVEVKLIKHPENLKFSKTEATIKNINTSEEKKASFEFEVRYNSTISKKDTVEFLITYNKTFHLTKQFIFSYLTPKEYRLYQNYPNPFNPSTKISWQSPVGSWQTLKVYDILGSEVITLVNEEKEPGYYEIEFDAGNIASGVYIYRLTVYHANGGAEKYISVKKMLMVK